MIRLFIFLILLLAFSSCNLLNPQEPTHTDIVTDTVYVDTTGTIDTSTCVWNSYNGIAVITGLTDTIPSVVRALHFDFVTPDASDTLKNLTVLLSRLCESSITVGGRYDAHLRYPTSPQCKPYIELKLNDLNPDCL